MDLREFLTDLAFGMGSLFAGFALGLTFFAYQDEKKGTIRQPPPLWVTLFIGLSYTCLGLSAMLATILSLQKGQPLDLGFLSVMGLRFVGFTLGLAALFYVAAHRERVTINPATIGSKPEWVSVDFEERRK